MSQRKSSTGKNNHPPGDIRVLTYEATNPRVGTIENTATIAHSLTNFHALCNPHQRTNADRPF